MKNFEDMTFDEKIAESLRRDDRRARGLPIAETPAELAARTEEEDRRLEREIQHEVRRLYIAHGCKVYNLSQARASKQTPGIGDLWVIHRRLACAWWHETKTPSGEPSPDQITFRGECHDAGIAYVLGGVRAAQEKLISIGAADRTATGGIEPTVSGGNR